jgi:hypothetical protein
MRNSKRILGALAVAGLVAAGGSAFTAGNTGMPATDTIGYNATTVTGATVNSLTYNYSIDKDEVASVTLVLDLDTTTNVVEIGFNANAPVSCGTGTYNATTTETTYTCNGGNFPQAVSTLEKTGLFVS